MTQNTQKVTPSFSEILFTTRRLNINCDKYNEIVLLQREFHAVRPKFKKVRIKNRKYVNLDARYKILDSFLFSKLQEKYPLSKNNYSLKGVHHTIKKAYPLFLNTKYHLKTDIKNYFPSINKKDVYDKIKDFEYFNQLKSLLELEKGLPLGLIVSGYLSNILLKEMDDFFKNYFRYVDDILIFSDSRSDLLKFKSQIHNKLRKHDLVLNHSKTFTKDNNEIDYLGYKFTKDSLYPRESIMKSFFDNLNRDNPELVSFKPWFCFPS